MMRQVAIWTVLGACLLAQEPQGGANETFPWFGRIDGDNVRVRGGAGDFHAILDEVSDGLPVRVLGREADWLNVEVPGGVAVHIALSSGSKQYLSEPAPGQGVVLVDDLMVRGDASTDLPPIGRLMTGDRVVVLDKKDGFARILAPASVKSWVHQNFVARAEDQAALESEFMTRHRAREQELLASGAASKALVSRAEEQGERASRAAETFRRFEQEQQKPGEERDLAGLREDLTQVRDAAAEGDPQREQAEEMLATVTDWEQARTDLEKARKKLEEVARQASEAEQRYARDLEALRKERERLAESGRQPPPESAYLSTGWIRRSTILPGVGEGGPPFGLFQGQNRKYVLESERYDLSEYTNKLVGIVRGEGPTERPGLTNRVIRVERLEILDAER